jgi:hypothetical protein
MTYDVHPEPVSLIQYFSGVDHLTHRVTFCLDNGMRYYVADILEEWQNAVSFIPEPATPGSSTPEPMLVFKDRITTVLLTERPPPRRGKEEE